MSKPKDVYWLVAPLAIYKDVGLAKLSKAVKGDKPEHYRFLTWAQHWAIQVDENCYEFSATEGKKLDIKGTGKLRLRVVAKNAWWKIRNEWNVHVDTHKVGQTLKSVKQLEDAAERIWNEFGENKYHFLVRNCQNFARLFHDAIRIQPGEASVAENERALWKEMDEPVSHPLAAMSERMLTSGGSVGAMSLYVAALAEIAEAGGFEAALAMETAGIASTTGIAGASAAEAGAAGAAGGTGATGGTAASGATTAEGAAAANSASVAGGGGSQAGTQTAAAGSTKAGGVSAAKGGAASAGKVGGAATGKLGLTAKAAGVSHAAMHAAGTAHMSAVGASMIKVGGATAVFHPVAAGAVAATGAGLVYLVARGKKDKKYSKSQRQAFVRKLDSMQTRDEANGGKDGKWLQKLRDLMDKHPSNDMSQWDFEDAVCGLPKEANIGLEEDERIELEENLHSQAEEEGKEQLESKAEPPEVSSEPQAWASSHKT